MLNFNSATIHAISQVFHRYATDEHLRSPETIWEDICQYAEERHAEEEHYTGVAFEWAVYARQWAVQRAFDTEVFTVARALIEAVEGAQ